MKPRTLLPFIYALLALTVVPPARTQETPASTQSIVQAARNAREQQSNSAKNQKVFTNDDLGLPASLPGTPATAQEPSPKQAEALTQAPEQKTPNCDSPEDNRLKEDLQAAQDELDQLQRDLSYDPKVISNGDVDLQNFKAGSSGLAFGSPPLMQTQPQAPGRIDEVLLKERIASLKQASQIACAPPEDAETLGKIDASEKQLKLLQRQFDLDQSAYYSKPNYSEDTAGKARLDAERQQVEALQAEIDSLNQKLPPPKSN
jgi:hypothetical protein